MKKSDSECNINPETMNCFFVETGVASQCEVQVDVAGNMPDSQANSFSFRCVDHFEVLRAFKSITSNAVGTVDLCPKFLKLILPFTINVICHIFNFCFTTSQFPCSWKNACVIPLPKTRSPSMPSDFRPISLLCFLAKVFEKLMYWQTVDFLNSEKLLCKWQSGFRPRHSCESAVIKLTSDVLTALDVNEVTLLALLDFTKAFNTVRHDLLLTKLRANFGFDSSSVRLFMAFLGNRTQQTRVKGSISRTLALSCGVPQGSILGPLLFSLFINDLHKVIKFCHVLLYADDVQIYISRPIGLIEDCVARLNEDLERVLLWSRRNSLVLNPAKSMCLPISRSKLAEEDLPHVWLGQYRLQLVDRVRNLGVLLNSRMTCCDFIGDSLRKIYSILRLLRFYTQLLTPNMKLKLVKSLLLPHFLYCRLPFLKLDSGCRRKVEVAFNSCARFIFDLNRSDHVSQFVIKILGLPFEDYLRIRAVVFLHKVFTTREPAYLFENLIFLRSNRHNNLGIPAFKSKFGERSYFVQAIRIWNSLPYETRATNSSGIFRSSLFRLF